MAKWVNLDDCVEISVGDMNFYPVELLGDICEEVMPVIHAHWVKNPRWVEWSCTNCNAVQQRCTRYCGWCGAKMDEGA